MARKKISELESATDVTASDLIQIVDVEDSGMAVTGTNKKATASLLAKELAKQPLEPGVVISGSSSSDAVTITQTGNGSALLVQDAVNPDSTPFVIDKSGVVGIGTKTPESTFNMSSGIGMQSSIEFSPSLSIRNKSSDANASYIIFSKDRNDAIAQSNDSIGNIVFQSYDGSSYFNSVLITARVEGTPSTNSTPGRLAFLTTPNGSTTPNERMRITSAGNVGIGTTAPNASCLLHLSSTTSGFLPPSMTTAQRDLIATPIAGVMIYNNSTNKLNFYNGSAWEVVTSAV